MKMLDRVVVLKAIAGLGNRLRTVAAAMEYAEKTDRKLYVDWKDGMFADIGENAFNKYFEIIDFPVVLNWEKVNTNSFYPSVYSKLDMDKDIYYYFEKAQIGNRFVRKGLHYIFRLGDSVNRKLKINFVDSILSDMSMTYQRFELKEEYKKVYGETGRFAFGDHLKQKIESDSVIYCDNIPFYNPEYLIKHIRLKPWIQREVDDFVNKAHIAEDTVGIHVRASGKECFGNIEKFIVKLKNFIKDHNIKLVFLCTDNAEIEKRFQKEFGSILVVQPKYLPEIQGDETGIHDHARDSGDMELKNQLTKEAIIDMFALAKTTYLFYQFGSTFSEISKVYHRDPKKCKSWMAL